MVIFCGSTHLLSKVSTVSVVTFLRSAVNKRVMGDERQLALARLNARRLDESSSARRAHSPVVSTNSERQRHAVSVFNRAAAPQSRQPTAREQLVASRHSAMPVAAKAAAPRGIPGHEVLIESFGDTTERIQIRAVKDPGATSRMAPATREQFAQEAVDSGYGGAQYSRPPQDPAGRLVDVSDRPLACAAFNGTSEVVFGGTDHALYALDLSQPRRGASKLYSKRWGHSDWVTGCAFLSSGRVLSGAMDSKLCLWSADKRRCQELTHHTRSVSSVRAGDNDSAFSASYDGTVAVWALGGGERATDGAKPCSVFTGHKSAVLELAVRRSLLASGGKDGALLCWEVASGQCLMRMRAHDAAVTALLFPPQEGLLVSGSADGFVKTWDPRTKAQLSAMALHSDKASGSGAPVAGLAAVGEHYLVSGGADSAVHVLDRRRAAGPVCSFSACHTGVYSVAAAPDERCVFVGDGAGMLYCFDVHRGQLCYGLGASEQGAVRCVVPAKDFSQVVTGGEDGKALVFSFAR